MATTPETRVEWRSFGEEAFEEAAEAGVPVLLSLTATWCRSCHEMDREVYADPGIAADIDDGFVPVRADVDRRPRVRDRYNMGGFPSTVFLTPDGEVLTGATSLSADAFRSVTERVRELWEEKGAEAGRIPRSLREDPPVGEVTDGIEGIVAGRLREEFDPDYGGWSSDAKFPLPRTIEFALKREPELATRTLDPIRQHLRDTYDGGFFRYAGERDWSDPRREKLTDENAALLRAFATAYLHTGDEAYRETASEAVTFLTTTLWTGEAFAGGQAPAEPGYYRLAPAEREEAENPPVDPTPFAGPNALAADALLTYHAYTDDDVARRYAERALGFIEDELIDDGVVRRYPAEGAPEALLSDHARVVRGFATAAQTLDRAFEGTATAVADRALSDLDGDPGFVDGPRSGAGLLSRPLYSIDANAEFADALLDLHALAGEERYREAARDAIAAFAGARERLGVQVAGYATAAARLEGPLRIEVSTPPGSDLHRAALRIADHEKVVIPDADGPEGTATAVIDGVATDPAATPDGLVSRVRERLG